MKYYLAVDIGASSGRHIVGRREGGAVKTEEVCRFPNGVMERDGHLVWDVDALLAHVEEGIDRALGRFPDIESLSIDTWGWTMCSFVGTKRCGPAMPTGTAGRRRSLTRCMKRSPSRSCMPAPGANSSRSTRLTLYLTHYRIVPLRREQRPVV